MSNKNVIGTKYVITASRNIRKAATPQLNEWMNNIQEAVID